MKPVWITEQVMEGLPYHLTKAQLNAWHEIERDLAHTLMSRLVQATLEAENDSGFSGNDPYCGKWLSGSIDGAHRGTCKSAF